MLKTFSLRMRELPLTVYGPPGLRELYDALGRVFGRLTYPVELVELRAGDALQHDGDQLCAFPVSHGVPALGYAIVEQERPGRFDDAGADALGVPLGPSVDRSSEAKPSTLADGNVSQPNELVGQPPRRSHHRLLWRHAPCGGRLDPVPVGPDS